jgi:hypothetical protein
MKMEQVLKVLAALDAWDSIGIAVAVQNKSASQAMAIFFERSRSNAKAVAPALIRASQALGNHLNVASKFVEGADEAEQVDLNPNPPPPLPQLDYHA